MNIQDTGHQATGQLPRTGPVSRFVRLLFAAVSGWFAFEWAEAGLTWFSKSSTPSNLWVWVVTGLAIYYGLYQLAVSGFGPPWGRRVVAVFVVVLATAAGSALVAEGELWAAPLTWLLYGVSVGFLIVVTIAHLVAIVLGTPGCEMEGMGELIRRLRRTFTDEGQELVSCIAGLHRLDAWEARQPWRQPVDSPEGTPTHRRQTDTNRHAPSDGSPHTDEQHESR